MAILTNAFGNCDEDLRGTGIGDCIKKFGDPTGLDIFDKGWTSTIATDDFDETAYDTLIQSETMAPINGIANFQQNTPENSRFTGNTGLLSLIRAGKPFFTFSFDSGGYEQHKSIYSRRSKDRYDVAIKFDQGIFLATNVAGTAIKGFDNGIFDVESFKFIDGDNPEMTDAVFQLKSPLEFNTRGVFITWDAAGFDGNQKNGVINAKLSYNVDPSASNTIQVVVKDAGNESVNIGGLTNVNNWSLGGTQTSATAINAVAYDTSGFYTLTLDTALVSTDTVQPMLADVSGGYSVAKNASGDMYKGKTSLFTIP